LPETCGDFLCFAPDLSIQNEDFPANHFGQLSEIEPKHFWFLARNKLVQWALQRHFSSARTLLEVGCGTGFVLSGLRQRFPNLQVVGTDIHSDGLSFARKRLPDIELLQMDARKMPYESEFDVIGAFDVLEHVDDDGQVLAEFYRSCRPGGGIILTVPQHQFLWSAADDHAYHKRRYARRELLDRIRRAGFTLLQASSFVSLLLPVMWASRKRRRALDASFDLLAEFRIHPALNRTLGAILSLERLLITSGFSMPAGGSLLVVALKQTRLGPEV
jgi:SAM-dependent methyltransferase